MQTTTLEISQLLRRAKNGNLLIPQFQRDFVWKEAQTKLLIDSISRNYPIGSILVLGKTEEINLSARKLDATYADANTGNESNEEPTAESFYILDGQQRLTSIVRVFLDSHPRNNYYFDLKAMHEVFTTEDTSWIISRSRTKKNPDRMKNNRHLRSDIAMDQEKCDVYIAEYIEDSDDFPEFRGNKTEARKAAARIKGIFETIRKFNVPLVILDNSTSLESICRVFETINSTGTRLTTFDLAVARYYPDTDLKSLYEETLLAEEQLKEYDIDGERILQVLSLHNLRKQNKFIEATRRELLSMENSYIQQNWRIASHHLAQVCLWMRAFGVTPKASPPPGVLASIGSALMCFPDCLRDIKISQTLRRWYYCTTLAMEPSPANNYKVGDDFKRLCAFIEKGEALHFPRVYFSTDQLIKIKSVNESKYKTIYSIMSASIKHDLYSGMILSEMETEDHHIFPYSLKQSGIHKDTLNSIANKTIISKASNRLISNKNPSSYIGEAVVAIASYSEILKDAFIPTSYIDDLEYYFSHRRIDAFLLDRASLIIAKIKDLVGDAWEEPTEEENVSG